MGCVFRDRLLTEQRRIVREAVITVDTGSVMGYSVKSIHRSAAVLSRSVLEFDHGAIDLDTRRAALALGDAANPAALQLHALRLGGTHHRSGELTGWTCAVVSGEPRASVSVTASDNQPSA
jgi:hypothetical protein